MIITADQVRKISEDLKTRPPENLEETFIYRYYNRNPVWNNSLAEECKSYLTKLDWVFIDRMFDIGCMLALPNLIVCKTTGVKGERELFNFNLPYTYYPNLINPHIVSIAINMEEGFLSDIILKFKDEFKLVCGEDFTALSDSDIYSKINDIASFSNLGKSRNSPKYKLKVDGLKFSFKLCSEHVVEIPDSIIWSHSKIKSEKCSLEKYPNKYLSKGVLEYCLSNFIINDWEYKFYLDILSKPKPRKLSKKQSEIYQKINRKIYWEI